MPTANRTQMKTNLTHALIFSALLLGAARTNAQSVASNTTSSTPALLLGFSGSFNNNAIQLKWTMENETNCKWFVIERSGEGGGFDSINVVAGINNANETDYNFTDLQPLKGGNYYRLRQVDRDGVVKYSKVVSLYNTNVSAKVQVFPNPATATINYTVPATAPGQVTVQICNLAGVVIMTRQQQVVAGSNQESIAISGLQNGNYFLKISNRAGSTQFVQSFVKVM